MMHYTHLAFAFLFGLLSRSYVNTGNIYLFFGFVLVGGLLPDIDHSESKIGKKFGFVSKAMQRLFGHRGVIHTLWGMILFCGLFWYFINETYGIALAIGFFSHLVGDGLTKQGINFLHPVSRLHLAGFIRTGSFLEKLIFGFLVLVIITMLW